MADAERSTLTVDEALSVLPEGEYVHTFRGGGMCVIGADWGREDIEELIRKKGGAELTGPGSRGMKHGIAVNDGSWLYIATDEAKLTALEEAIAKEDRQPFDPQDACSQMEGDADDQKAVQRSVDRYCERSLRRL